MTILNAPPPDRLPPPPRWVRLHAGAGLEEALFAAGAALAALDPVARDTGPLGQLWRRRLALAGAVANCRLEGRREEEGQLRDAWVLRAPGDDPGPAGRRLAAWRQLGEPRALNRDRVARLPAFFDLPAEPALTAVLTDLGARLPGRALPPRRAAEAAAVLLRRGPDHRGLALWVADAVLAQGLGWDRPLPLLPSHLPRAALREEDPEAWLTACAAAWAKGAVAAHDLYADLARRAARLLAVAPKLRGRDAAAAVNELLREDALAARAGATASDRAARRLFDRLTGLGVVRELTGRPTFRLYGL